MSTDPGAGGRDERGATAVEYAIMVALITVAIAGAVTIFGLAVNGLFQVPPPF